MKKHSSKKKALLIALAVIVVLILGAVGAVYGVTHGFYRSSNYTSDEDAMKDFTNVGEDTTAEDEVNPEDATGEVLSDEEQQELDAKLAEFADSEPVTNDGNVYNVLLVGVDRRDKSWAGNSDSMILMSLNYEKKQISMISLMRDTYVNIPGIGMRKLNAAHANGAGPLLLETVTQNYKVQVDRVGNEVRQRTSKDLANNLNLAMVTIYTFLLFFCCFGCYKGEKPGNKGFFPATGSATG